MPPHGRLKACTTRSRAVKQEQTPGTGVGCRRGSGAAAPPAGGFEQHRPKTVAAWPMPAPPFFLQRPGDDAKSDESRT